MAEYRLTQTEPSLNPPSQELVNITINGIQLQVPKGENIIESARKAGIDIPYFCYHPRLSKGQAANCRMCLVEVATKGPDGSVRKMPKPQTSCTLPASEGLIIETETEQIAQDRRGILEFLLINHPLDCPICDRGGECPLQNNTLFYGPATTRYIEEKRHYPKAYPLSDYVVFDRERCIHCARCTRFTEDISGDAQLAFLKRGADMEVATFAQTQFRSRFSGNVIELCPVGALLSRTYRFKARPWDLFTTPSICTKCSNGCNIKLDYRMSTLVRVNARLNEGVNEEWTCDKGKFGHDYVSAKERLTTPLARRDGGWHPISWNEAYQLLAMHLKVAGKSVGGIGGARCTNEDNFLFQKFFRQVLGVNNLDCRTGRWQGPTNAPLYERYGFHGMGNAIADLEQMKTIFVFGSELVEEQPILYLRVRKAWRYKEAVVLNANSVSASSEPPHVRDFAKMALCYKPGTEVPLLNGLLHILFAENLLPNAQDKAFTSLAKSVARWTPERTAKETGLPVEKLQQTARLLTNAPLAILAGRTVTEHPHFPDVAAALGNLLLATGNPVTNLNVPPTECNSQGAMDMGVLPDVGPGYTPLQHAGLTTHQMLESAASGQLHMLWIVGADLAVKYHDRELAHNALTTCPFVVVSELTLTETAKQAHLVLPAASFAEKDGTFTNCERRVQRVHKAFEIAPHIKPDWLIFAELADILRHPMPYFSPRDILCAISSEVPLYADITPQTLGEQGLRWQYPANQNIQPRPIPVEYHAE